MESAELIGFAYKNERGNMKQVISYKKEGHPINFLQTCAEIDRLTADVNHIVRVNGSSAFPMPAPKKKIGLIGRIIGKLKHIRPFAGPHPVHHS